MLYVPFRTSPKLVPLTTGAAEKVPIVKTRPETPSGYFSLSLSASGSFHKAHRYDRFDFRDRENRCARLFFVKRGSACRGGTIPRRALTAASHSQGYTKAPPFSRKKSCEPSQNQDNPQFFCFISRSFIRFSKCDGPSTRSVGPKDSTRITISVSSSLS